MITDQRSKSLRSRRPFVLPNFLICGVAKGGTTSLHRYLNEHPSICMSSIKEVNYFTNHYGRGIEWYAKHFKGCGGAKLIGEASASYMTFSEASRRIHNVIPHARLLFILRDPVRRAYSSYWFRVRRGAQNPAQGFSAVIRTSIGESIYVRPGFYVDHLLRFVAFFPRQHIHVIFTEELDREPRQCLKSCFEFLGVESSFLPIIGVKHNVRKVPNGALSAALLRGWFATRIRVRRFVPLVLTRASKPLWQPLRNLLLDTHPIPSVREEDRAYLEEIYRPYNERLSRLLEIDIEHIWK